MRAVVATVVALLAVRSTEAFQEDMNITDLDKPPVDLDAIDAPRDVYVTVAVNKVGSIDSMASTFKFDFYIYVAWRDDRQPEGEFVPDGSTWWPQPEIMNFHEGVKGEWFCLFAPGSPKFTKLNTDEGMWAVCQTRHQPFLDAEVLLLDFPFDHQNANIEIESFMWGSNTLKFVAAPSLQAGIMPPGGNMAVSGWKIRNTDVITRDHEYKLFGETYHQIVLVLALQRLPDYYVSRYVWGAVFLVAMCFLSLCIPSQEADRSALALGSFLGIVAWEYILVESLPPTGYNTRLDDFMVISMVCVLILYAWNTVRCGKFGWFDSKVESSDKEESDAGASEAQQMTPKLKAASVMPAPQSPEAKPTASAQVDGARPPGAGDGAKEPDAPPKGFFGAILAKTWGPDVVVSSVMATVFVAASAIILVVPGWTLAD